MIWRIFICTTIILCSIHVQGQSINEPQLSTFIGKVYKIPPDSLFRGYRSSLKNLDVYTTVEWQDLNYPSRSSDDFYPGIDLKSSFAIDFHSQLTISCPGLYLFGIKSDDGSRLWINNKLVINNDLNSRAYENMKLVADSIMLKAGVYDLRIWYYQAYPVAMGLQFRAKLMRPIDPEPDPPPQIVSVYFNSNEAHISQEDSLTLIEFLNSIENMNTVSINIYGYTDDIGSNSYNLALSQQRAQTVKQFIQSVISRDIPIVTSPMGESHPIKLNRSMQRRVDVEIMELNSFNSIAPLVIDQQKK